MKIPLFKKKFGGYEDIIIYKKKAVYENTFIGDFPEPEPEPKKCNCFGSGQKGRLRLRNTALIK